MTTKLNLDEWQAVHDAAPKPDNVIIDAAYQLGARKFYDIAYEALPSLIARLKVYENTDAVTWLNKCDRLEHENKQLIVQVRELEKENERLKDKNCRLHERIAEHIEAKE